MTEYRLCSVSCPGCGVVTAPEPPKAASGRVAYGPRVKARAAWLVAGHFLPVRRATLTLNALLASRSRADSSRVCAAPPPGCSSATSCRRCAR